MSTTHGWATLRQISMQLGLNENTLYVLRSRHKGKGFPEPQLETKQIAMFDVDEVALWYAERHPIEVA